MPKKKGVPSLKDCSLLNIAKHMEDIWCADYTKNFMDQGHFMYIIGPFFGFSEFSAYKVYSFFSYE